MKYIIFFGFLFFFLKSIIFKYTKNINYLLVLKYGLEALLYKIFNKAKDFIVIIFFAVNY